MFFFGSALLNLLRKLHPITFIICGISYYLLYYQLFHIFNQWCLLKKIKNSFHFTGNARKLMHLERGNTVKVFEGRIKKEHTWNKNVV